MSIHLIIPLDIHSADTIPDLKNGSLSFYKHLSTYNPGSLLLNLVYLSLIGGYISTSHITWKLIGHKTVCFLRVSDMVRGGDYFCLICSTNCVH